MPLRTSIARGAVVSLLALVTLSLSISPALVANAATDAGSSTGAPARASEPTLDATALGQTVTNEVTQDAYTSPAEVRQVDTTTGWKSSLFQVREPIVLRQIGFAGGPGGAWELRRSSAEGGWLQLLASGHLSTTDTNGFYTTTIAPRPVTLQPGFYTLHVHVDQGSYAFGTAPKAYSRVVFLKSSEQTTDVNVRDGTFQMRLVYVPGATAPSAPITGAQPASGTMPGSGGAPIASFALPLALATLGLGLALRRRTGR